MEPKLEVVINEASSIMQKQKVLCYYRLSTICTDAEPMALLSASVIIAGEEEPRGCCSNIYSTREAIFRPFP